MKQLIATLVFVIALTGCSGKQTTRDSNGRVPFKPTLEPLVGEWASNGELALIVERDGGDIVVRNPENDTWRFEISDIASDGTSVMFTQRNFLSDGSAHPFNGVPCKCRITPVPNDPDSMTYKLTSPQLTDGESEIMKRLR